MRDFVLYPQYAYQADVWDVEGEEGWRAGGGKGEGQEGGEVEDGGENRLVVCYGSQTGMCESFAKEVKRYVGKREAL